VVVVAEAETTADTRWQSRSLPRGSARLPNGYRMHLSIDTILPADSVEFCPHPDASNIFVCGTYKLQDERNLQPSDSISTTSGPAGQIRTGQCLVFEVDSEQDIRACAPYLRVISESTT
jgi:hypothetical protein